jgi:hypothetical protein
MAIEVVTKQDLLEFRLQLLNDIRQLMAKSEGKLVKPWLKNSEVKTLLGISSNTLQRLRTTGKLRSTKVGGVHYYRYEDIETLFNNNVA